MEEEKKFYGITVTLVNGQQIELECPSEKARAEVMDTISAAVKDNVAVLNLNEVRVCVSKIAAFSHRDSADDDEATLSAEGLYY